MGGLSNVTNRGNRQLGEVGLLGAGFVESGEKTVLSNATPEPLKGTDTPCKSIYLQTIPTNTGRVYIGGAGGQDVVFEPGDPIPVIGIDNANKLYIAVENDGEGVNYLIVG